MELEDKNEELQSQSVDPDSEIQEAETAVSEEVSETAPETVKVEEAAEAAPETAKAEEPAEETPEEAAVQEAPAEKAVPEPEASKAAVQAEAAAAPAEEQEDQIPKQWYVIHTYSGHENKVKENIMKMVHASSISEQFGRLIVPTEEVAEMKKGKKTITTRKFFPSYILIEMYMSDESWHLVNGIPGVTSFVGTGMKPQPLSKPEVERILGRMDKDKETIIPEIPFTLGEHIRIKDGPFSDFTGVIDEINAEKGKLRVLVSIFGRETPVELDFLQVETL
jgi:transcriptional antiterminator NusG